MMGEAEVLSFWVLLTIIEAFQAVFEKFDTNGDGVLDVTELGYLIVRDKILEWFWLVIVIKFILNHIWRHLSEIQIGQKI